MTVSVAINLLIFAGLLIALGFLTRAQPLSRRVLAGMLTGLAFGLALQLVHEVPIIEQTIEWTNVVANGYVSLLRMVVMPLVLIMMIGAVLNMRDVRLLGRTGTVVITILVGNNFTTRTNDVKATNEPKTTR